MNKKMVTLSVMVALLATLTLGATWVVAEEIWHVVRPGENLSSIARMYGVTVDEIASANGITNPNLIYVGQRLLIPSTAYTVHIVQIGETLSSIAFKYGVSYWDIARLNGLTNPNVITPGQRLLIPTGTAPTPTPTPTPTLAAPTVQEAIVISSPEPNATISSPVTITGFGSAFENTLAVNVLDETGSVVGTGYVMVDAEVGQYGPFTGVINYTAPSTTQVGRVQIFSVSPRDGAIEHLTSVNVKLQAS